VAAEGSKPALVAQSPEPLADELVEVPLESVVEVEDGSRIVMEPTVHSQAVRPPPDRLRIGSLLCSGSWCMHGAILTFP
jgi:hypothetical protein